MQYLIYRDGSGGGTGKSRLSQWLGNVQPPVLTDAIPPRPARFVQPFSGAGQVKLPLTLPTHFRAFAAALRENRAADGGNSQGLRKTL